MKRFSFSWFQPVSFILPGVVFHFWNGKRERLPPKVCKELVGPSYIYFHVVTCLTCLPLVADSCLLCSKSVFLCAYMMCGVKFGHVFHLKIFQIPLLSLVACLSPRADGVWTLLSQEGLLLLKGGVLLFFDSGNIF